MLTPQDVQSKEFTKAVFGGYDMSTVDEFLEELYGDYAALYKENAILKSKLKVLVEKVEEYRSTEDAMRMALKTAQQTGDSLLEETKEKCERMLSDSQKSVKDRMAEIQKEVQAEERRLALARENTAEFVDMVQEICHKQLDFLTSLGELQMEEPENSEEQFIEETAKDIENSLSKIVESSFTTAEPAKPEKNQDDLSDTRTFTPEEKELFEEEEPITPRPRFDFSNLQFGSNYERE
jgi:cell division initiation protein